MVDPIVALGEALNADLFRMQSISQNLTNINTPGYKREIPVLSSFGQLIPGANLSDAQGAQSNLSNITSQLQETMRDMSSGALRSTGSSLDLAISGDSFFAVETENGEAYTKKGQLALDNLGRLVLRSGEQLLGSSGVITLKDDDFTIDKSGRIYQQGNVVDQLKMVGDFSEEDLVYLGSGLFQLEGGKLASELSGSTRLGSEIVVSQGFIESSNVDVTTEMVRMIEVVRHFETSFQVLRGYDGMLDVAINTLADTNV